MKSSDEKKVLFVSGRFPFPLHKGDQLVLFNNIRLVSQKYKVTLITFYDNESELENLHKIKKYCEKVVLIKRFAIFSYINIIFSIFRLEPMQVSYYRSGLFKKKLNLLLSVDRFDLIHVYMLRMAHYVKDIPTPKVIGLIDSMHLNMSRRALNETGLKKVIFKYEAWLLKSYEKKCIEWFDRGVVVSRVDKMYINNSDIKVIPVGVSVQERDNYKHSKTIIFTGNMGYFPNQDAVKWFIDNCLKLIIKKIPEISFVVVGKNPPQSLERLNDNKNIFVKGFVKSIQCEMQGATISVAPMQSGSGMQIKILESMASSLPVVTTTIGLGDIKAKNGESILVAETAEEFSFKCLLLLTNINQRTAISNSALDYVKKNHSWNNIKNKYLNLYEEATSSYNNKSLL
jgi:polysaccharide biosynthesis protein PslH